MEKSVKHLFKATMKKLSLEWVKYQKRRIYKQMVSGVKLNKLSKEEKEEIRSYYEKHLGNAVNPRWHQYYYSINGCFTPKYVPLGLYYADILPLMNDRSVTKAYADKNFTERLFPDVLQPKSIVKNINGFYYEGMKVISEERALDICSNLSDAIIKQAVESAQGKSVIRFSSVQGKTDSDNCSVKELFKKYKKNFIVQQAVIQHPELSRLNPTSLNTVRLTTFRRENEVVVLTSLLRMGRKGSKVDNVSVGGVFCEIENSGKLKSPAYGINPTGVYEENDFGLKYDGVVVPLFQQIVDEAKSMHMTLPYTRIIGWDFTVNDKNEVGLIELNLHSPGVYQLIGPALGNYTDEILEMVRQSKK